MKVPDSCLTIHDDFGMQEFSAKLKVGYFVDGYISEIITPDKFYIQLKSTEHVLNELMDDLQDFYCDKRNSTKYDIPDVGSNLVGIPVAAIFFNQKSKVSEGWHRGIIKKVTGVQEVSVFYCDYGSCANVYLPYVRFLHKRFGYPKGQAIRVRYDKIYIFKVLFFTKFTFFLESNFSQNSQFQSFIVHKIHNFKVSLFTKFTFFRI